MQVKKTPELQSRLYIVVCYLWEKLNSNYINEVYTLDMGHTMRFFFLQRADKLRHLRPKSAKCTARPTSLAFAGDFEE